MTADDLVVLLRKAFPHADRVIPLADEPVSRATGSVLHRAQVIFFDEGGLGVVYGGLQMMDWVPLSNPHIAKEIEALREDLIQEYPDLTERFQS